MAKVVCDHFKGNVLLSEVILRFRPGRPTSDQMRLLNRLWQDTLDEGRDTVFVALELAGAFDKVQH